jgi:hypothetical protein
MNLGKNAFLCKILKAASVYYTINPTIKKAAP